MPRYLISLVGELVIPNLLLIKTLPNIDRHVFLCPRGGKGQQVRRLSSLCGIAEPLVLEVDEFSLKDVDQVLKTQLGSNEAEYWVNLTGGSRIMALAAFAHFRHLKAQILYLPPRKNSFQLLWPSHQENHLQVDYRLDLQNCLQIHGVRVIRKAWELKSRGQLEAMFGIITQNSNSPFMNRLNRLGSKPQNSGEEQSMAGLSSMFRDALGISPREVMAPAWLSFVKGAWFEEYMAFWVGKVLGNAYHGVVIEKEGVRNELDCAFMHENLLYIMELKASAQIGDVNGYLYKLDSLSKDYGLLPRSLLVIADPDVERDLRKAPQILHRAKAMGIKILCFSELKPANIEATLRELFKV